MRMHTHNYYKLHHQSTTCIFVITQQLLQTKGNTFQTWLPLLQSFKETWLEELSVALYQASTSRVSPVTAELQDPQQLWQWKCMDAYTAAIYWHYKSGKCYVIMYSDQSQLLVPSRHDQKGSERCQWVFHKGSVNVPHTHVHLHTTDTQCTRPSYMSRSDTLKVNNTLTEQSDCLIKANVAHVNAHIRMYIRTYVHVWNSSCTVNDVFHSKNINMDPPPNTKCCTDVM